MRKITKEALKAFTNNTNWRKSNTSVEIIDDVTIVRLFGHSIIKKKNNNIFITDSGHCTRTTAERLRGITDVKIRMCKGKWIVNEKEEWGGEWKFIDEFKK